MPRHFRVWLQSADGLIGRKGIVKIPGEFKPTIYTGIWRRREAVLSADAPSSVDLELQKREYSFWKQEGRKLWYREVIQ